MKAIQLTAYGRPLEYLNVTEVNDIGAINDDEVIKFSEKDMFKDMKTWIHCGSPELESNLGTFGFPVGISEIAGKSRSGKTTLALMGMLNFQKQFYFSRGEYQFYNYFLLHFRSQI